MCNIYNIDSYCTSSIMYIIMIMVGISCLDSLNGSQNGFDFSISLGNALKLWISYIELYPLYIHYNVRC